MPVGHLAIIPAAPLLLPDASPAQPSEVDRAVARLREAVDAVLARLPAEGSVLLLDSGPESLVHDAPRASLAGYGAPDVASDVTIDAGLLSAVSARGQAPRVRSDRLDGDPAVLALLLARAHPRLAVAPVTVPASASFTGLTAVAAGLVSALASRPEAISVVATGDLAATLEVSSPGYHVEGARTWDQRAVAAVRAGDAHGFGKLGPAGANRVKARGWAPITVALLLAGPRGPWFDEVTYLAPRGVGQLVAG